MGKPLRSLPIVLQDGNDLQFAGWAKTRRSAARQVSGEIFRVDGELHMVECDASDIIKEDGCPCCGAGKRFLVRIRRS